MNNHARRIGNRMLSLLLTLVLLTLHFAGAVSADDSPVSTTLAEWKYSANPADQSVFAATYGVYKDSSVLQAVPARATETFGWDDGLKAIRYQGWHEETRKEKYWLATVSTKDFQQITLSSEQQGRGSTGPRDFRVQISTDKRTWTDVPNTDLTMTRNGNSSHSTKAHIRRETMQANGRTNGFNFTESI